MANLKQVIGICLICAGALLVVLPLTMGLSWRGHSQHQENYDRAMERLRHDEPATSEATRHQEALREANDLDPSPLPGYLCQLIGGCMILGGAITAWLKPARAPGL